MSKSSRDVGGDRLAAYQAALLTTLAEARSVDEALESLRSRPEFAPFSDYVRDIDPRAIEVGMLLVKQWSVRAAEPGPEADSRQMVAAVLREPRRPFELSRVPIREPGPGQVRIRVVASGVCGTDVHIHDGSYRVPLPLVCGHEPVGIVERVGEDVTDLQEGQRVGVKWLQRSCGQCAMCERAAPGQQGIYCRRPRTWIDHGGGHAPFMIAESTGCVGLPDGLSWELAAPVFCAGHTVMSGYRRAHASERDRVAVLGIGGLGHLAVQIAKARGHEVVALTGSEDKADDARALGADEVLVIHDHVGKELWAMGGADVVLSTSSSMRHNAQVLAGLRPEGRLVTMGLGDDGAMQIDPMALMRHQVAVVGARLGAHQDLLDVLDMVASGAITPRVEIYPLGRINQVMTRLQEGLVRHRAVLLHTGAIGRVPFG